MILPENTLSNSTSKTLSFGLFADGRREKKLSTVETWLLFKKKIAAVIRRKISHASTVHAIIKQFGVFKSVCLTCSHNTVKVASVKCRKTCVFTAHNIIANSADRRWSLHCILYKRSTVLLLITIVFSWLHGVYILRSRKLAFPAEITYVISCTYCAAE